MPTILIIDSGGIIPPEFDTTVRERGHEPVRVASLSAALARAESTHVDAAFLAAGLVEGTIAEDIRSLARTSSSPDVIIVGSAGTPDEAERAIKAGAWDYLDRSFSAQQFLLTLSRVLEYRSRRAGDAVRRPPAAFGGIVGQSAGLSACIGLARQAAESDANVLIVGETGTGKELFAAAIHENSRRAGRNFVVVDCAAIPETLVESTLLGHVKGAFTGAERAHVGLIKQADGGTLFLDEVSELPMATQKSFLRVLQERRFRPVGGTAELTSDFRIIAASNRDLPDLVERGRFRKDLLFRIRAFTIELPPLRERKEDIAELIWFHLPLLCARMGLPAKDVTPEFLEAVNRYSWPGNARELVNALERAIAVARDDPALFAAHLPTYVRVEVARQSLAPATDAPPAPPELRPLAEVRAAAATGAERSYLADLLRITGNDLQQALRLSGLSRSRLYALLKKHSLTRLLR